MYSVSSAISSEDTLSENNFYHNLCHSRQQDTKVHYFSGQMKTQNILFSDATRIHCFYF